MATINQEAVTAASVPNPAAGTGTMLGDGPINFSGDWVPPGGGPFLVKTFIISTSR